MPVHYRGGFRFGLALAVFLSSLTATLPALAAGDVFVWGMDNVPLMRGLREEYAFAAPTKRPGERSAQALLGGPRPIDEAMAYYADALTGTGWQIIDLKHDGNADQTLPMIITEDGTYVQMFQTETAIMTLSGSMTGNRSYIAIEIWQKEPEPGPAD